MAKQRYLLRVQIDSPLMVGDTQSMGNYRRSETVVPGRTLRGAVAASLRRESPAAFDDWFAPDAEQAAFGPLFPTLLGNMPALTPPTLFSCKHFPGFNSEYQVDDKHHGVFDTLTRQYACEAANEPAYPATGYLDSLRCPVCHQPAERFSGFLARPAITSTTHVAINRVRRVAQTGQLYTREGVSTDVDTDYAGWLDLPDDRAEALAQSLDGRQLRLGGNRSRGMGNAAVTLMQPAEPSHPLDRRVRGLNTALASSFELYHQLARYHRLPDVRYAESDAANQERYFTIDLHSAAVLLDERGLPTSDLRLVGEDDAAWAEVVRRWVSWQRVGGWHDAAKLPRRSQMGVSGVYLCRFTGPPNRQWLADLERDGIGLLCEQGFGQLTVCDRTHWE